jgi:hypothetical protein
MMRRVGLTALVMAILCTSGIPVDAAMLTSTGGKIHVDDGRGYRAVSNVTKVDPGSRISVGKNATALLHYPNGCSVTIAAGRSVTVARKPACSNATKQTWSGRSGALNADGAPDPTFVFVGGAAVTAGLVIAVTRHSSNGASP